MGTLIKTNDNESPGDQPRFVRTSLANIDLKDPGFEKPPCESFVAYGRSKTVKILFSVAFDLRHRERGIRAVAVHREGIKKHLASEEKGRSGKRAKSLSERNSKEIERSKSCRSWARTMNLTLQRRLRYQLRQAAR